MGFPSVLTMAHRLAAERIRPGDAVIDATVGNGVDTLFLCLRVGRRGTVYGCDIQEEAIERTRRRLAERLSEPPQRLVLVRRSHHELDEIVDARDRGRVSAVMFNLGWLPHGDPSVVTRPETTLPALDAALTLLAPGGVLTVVAYPGHPGGDAEAEAVERWARSLPSDRFEALLYRFCNRADRSPYLIAVEKRKRGLSERSGAS